MPQTLEATAVAPTAVWVCVVPSLADVAVVDIANRYAIEFGISNSGLLVVSLEHLVCLSFI